MFHFTKKRAIIMAVVGSLALGAGAYAYFSSPGSGTGTATTGTTQTVEITHTNISELGLLYPAGPARPVEIDVKNPGAGPQYVSKVRLDNITSDKGQACNVSSSGANAAFTMADVDVLATLGADATVHKSGTIAMNDTQVAQNGCQGAELTLHFSSN